MATSNLNLNQSSVGVDTDNAAATNEQLNITVLDAHDHTTGKGVKVPTGGLNINADLTFANNSATNVKSTNYSSQVSNVSATNCLFVKNGELYYIDNASNIVQITSGGAISVSTLTTGQVLLDNGNQRGANVRFGTKDAYSAIIKTNDTDRLTVNSSGFVQALYDLGIQKGSANSSTGTLNDVSTSAKSYFSFTGAAATTVTGFANGADGKILVLLNKTGFQLTINNNDSSSSAANRILTGTGAAITVENNASLILIYDAATSLWNVVGGTGGGSSGLPVYSINLAGGTLYNDSAAVPVDGTGGTTTGMTFAAVTSGTLRGAVSYKLSKDAANRQGNGVAFDLIIDTVDKSTVQSINFDVSASANFASGDANLYIYDVTNSTMLPLVTAIPTGTNGQFSRAIALTTGTQYRILVHVASTSALAYDITLDAMTVNSIIRPQVSAISDTLTSYTYTPNNWGTISNSSYTSWRNGDRLHARIGFQYGTNTGSALSISLPSGLTIDTTKMSSNASGSKVGTWVWFNPGAAQATYANSWAGDLFYDGSTNSQIFVATQVGSNAYAKATSTGAGANVFVYLEFSVPITQWSSGITLSSTNGSIEYASNSSSTDADDTTSFVQGAGGSTGVIGVTALTTTRKKRIQFSTPIQPTDRIVIEIGDLQGGVRNWIPVSGTYNAGGFGITPFMFDASTRGIGYSAVSGSNTQLDVTFGRYADSNAASYGGAGSAWNSGGFANIKWRVAKYSAIGGTELAPATVSSQGTVAFSQWTAYTPTITGAGTATNILFYYKREGKDLLIKGGFTSGTAAASLGSITLPTVNGSALLIDTTQVIANTGGILDCIGMGYRSLTGVNSAWSVLIDSTVNNLIYFGAGANGAGGNLVAVNGNVIWGNTEPQRIAGTIKIPIASWS
jgi:hypothetical protein